MSTSSTLEFTIHFTRESRRPRARADQTLKCLQPVGRLPRVTRLLALAHRMDEYFRAGIVLSQSELALLGHVSAARIAQIMNLLNLATDIQETILFLPARPGRAPFTLKDLQPIASTLDWREQRRLWVTIGNRCRQAPER